MDRPPLFFWNIGPAFAFFQSVAGLQLVMIGYSILMIAALVGIGVLLDGKLTGLLTGGLLAFNFTYFLASRKVMPEIPAMSLAFIALVLALRYRASGHLLWLIASGVAMGGSLLINYFMPWLIPLILLILAIPPQAKLALTFLKKLAAYRRTIIYNWLIWGVALLVIMLASWFVYGIDRVLDQAILFHLSKTAKTETTRAENIALIWERIFLAYPILLTCAAIGLAVAFIKFRDFGYMVIIWFGLTAAILLLYSPLRSKHLILLPPILSLLAALGLSHLLKLWFVRPQQSNPWRWSGFAGGLLLSMLLIVELANPYQVLTGSRRNMVRSKMQPLVELLDQFTTPADCVITDNPYLAFVANRMPPPWLANLSYARFRSGYMDTETLVDITNSYNCQVVAPTLDRLKNSNRTYYDWAKTNYLRVWVLEGEEIMLGKPLKTAQPEIPLNTKFAEQVELLGTDWLPGPQGGHLSLYWRTLQPFPERYKIFVQLRNHEGQTVASADHEVYDGLIPTQLWPVNAILKDTNHLSLPPDLEPGVYALYLGLYDPDTLERLPIINDTSGENAVVIPEFLVRS